MTNGYGNGSKIANRAILALAFISVMGIIGGICVAYLHGSVGAIIAVVTGAVGGIVAIVLRTMDKGGSNG